MLARRIPDNLALVRVIRDAKESMREEVYWKIRPHLKFHVLDFEQLMMVNPNGKVVKVG